MRKFIGPTVLTISMALGLYLLFLLYLSGQTMLAAVFLGLLTLTTFVFTSPRAYAYRYLFPGITAVIVFVLLPLVYTVSIGFTNFSSRNLLDLRARHAIPARTKPSAWKAPAMR